VDRPVLRARAIEKSFVPGRPVLRGVDFSLYEGEIHALLGENGAGKSTLMNVLVGLVSPDAGEIEIAGRTVGGDFGPREAARLGVAMVHQHSALVDALTVEENFALGDRSRGTWFSPRREAARLQSLVERTSLDVPVDTKVEDLSVGQRQRAEILRALDRGAQILILDEPTAALTPSETEALFPALRRLRDEGRAIVFISHKLDEVESLADRLSVLRQGERVAMIGPETVAREGLDAARLGRLMLGRDLPRLEASPAAKSPGEAVLELHGLCAAGLREKSRLRDLDLEVRAGEIVGVAGIDGNGQRELEEVLVGLRPIESGNVSVAAAAVPADSAQAEWTPGGAGLRHLSGDRERAGLVRGMTLVENWLLKRPEPRFFPHGLLDLARVRRVVAEMIERYRIVPPDPDADIATLSGGNAQKLAVARELEGQPAMLVAVNPTRGLDVGSARFVHERLLALRDEGVAVLLISTELDEVMLLADRLVALVQGRLVPVPAGSDRAQLGALMLGRQGAR